MWRLRQLPLSSPEEGRYRRVDEMCSLKRANHQRDVASLAASSPLNAGEAMTKICTVRSLQAKQ